MEIKPEKELRDPIHGFIPVYDHELKIIQDPVFQRLRRIKQLSFGYFVYHGAEHSRFGHALGVMHLADRALSKITETNKKYGSKIIIEDDDIKLARLAALLHDVGHYPFSHALDKSNIIEESHEKYSQSLVLNHFSSIIDKSGIEPELVAKLIGGKSDPSKPFLTTLINSQIDADKFDYLLRDSHYAGVKYGVYDLERLLDSLFIRDDGRLVVLDKGFFTAEQFVLARYLMFGQVYSHKTKRCFEGIAKKALQYLVEQKTFSYPLIEELNDESGIKDFINLDDAWLLKKIRDIDDSKISHWNQALENRMPFRNILDSEEITLKMKKKNEGDDGSLYLKGIIEDLEFQLAKGNLDKIDVTSEYVLLDKGGYLSYKLLPYAKPVIEKEDDDETDPILIYNSKSDSSEFIENRSKIIQTLGKKITLRRIYVHKSKQVALENYLFEKHPDLKP